MSRPIVVDGSNVAHESRSATGQPRMSNLVEIAADLRRRGYEPIVIVDASLRHQVDDPEQLEALLNDKRILQAPARTDADYFVLQTARQEAAPIVSNDTFERWADEFGAERKRRVPYMIIEGHAQLHEPSLEKMPAG